MKILQGNRPLAVLGVLAALNLAMAGEAAAKSLCGKLKARNIDCLVVRP